MKYYNVMFDEKKHIFSQPARNGIRTYKNIGKIATDPGNEY